MTARTVLFHRQYDQYSGGQQKVLDYFEHCLAHPNLDPFISWGSNSIPVESTPWHVHRERILTELRPAEHDLAFLAGMDWKDYLETGDNIPVINLIQHVRHADPGANVYPFLSEPATRICVSEEVKHAIDVTGRVNGRTVAIPNGIDTRWLESFNNETLDGSVYILGLKQPELARHLKETFAGKYRVTCHTEHVPRTQVLEAMATSEIAVLLPHETEGFFLPALEAMSLSRLVVVPDCVGNRSFCHHGVNCLMPALNTSDLVSAVTEAVSLIRSGRSVFFERNAHATLEAHTLDREREAFYAVIDSLGVF